MYNIHSRIAYVSVQPPSKEDHAIIKETWMRVSGAPAKSKNSLSHFVKVFYQHLFFHMPELETLFKTPGMQSKYLALTMAMTIDEGTTLTRESQRIGSDYIAYNTALGICPSTMVVIGRVLLLTLKQILPDGAFGLNVRIVWVSRTMRVIMDSLDEKTKKLIDLKVLKVLLQSTEVSNQYFLTSLKEEFTCPGVGGTRLTQYPWSEQLVNNAEQNLESQAASWTLSDAASWTLSDTSMSAKISLKTLRSPSLRVMRRKFVEHNMRGSMASKVSNNREPNI